MPTPAYEDLPINPQIIREGRWLLHRDKKPYYANGKPRSGKLDSAADIAKLAAFDDAITASKAGTWTGVGLAINRGLQFIDLDKCRDPATGWLEPWALTLANFAQGLGAFVEVSMSGTGMHIVGFGAALPTHKGKQIEVYTHGRYMALGIKVLHTGTDPLPDLTPMMALMDAHMVPAVKPKAALRLVKASPMLWNVERPQTKKLVARLNPDMDYPEWIAVGMALHDGSSGSQDGLDLWEDWSRGGEKWREGVCAKQWASFKPGGGVTMGTLHHMAQEAAPPKTSRVTKPKPLATGPVEEAIIRRTRYSLDELIETDFPETPWFVDSLLAPGLTLLAAPPKMGKSYFVMQMSMAVACGLPFLGKPTRQAKVAYFNLEEWPELVTQRARSIKRGLGHPGKIPNMHLVFELDPEVSIEEEIEAQVKDGVQLIVIDLLARIRDEVNEDAKKNAYARDYEVLRKFADLILQRFPHLAIVIVHHTNKGKHEEWQSQISGSQGLAGASHCNMLLANIDLRGLDDEQRKEALQHRRFHAAGKLVQGQELMLKMMPDMGGWEVTERTADDVKMMSKHRHILQILQEADGEWVTAKEVYEQCDGATLGSIKKMMLRMAQKGEIQSSGSGGKGYRIEVKGAEHGHS